MAIYDENGVPILRLSASSQDFVDAQHQKAVAALESHAQAVAAADDPESSEAQAQADASLELLHLGDSVVIHNKAPVNVEEGAPNAPDKTFVSIGASTLDEALKECIATFDSGHVREGDRTNTPDWVASTNDDLARLLAEHYNGGKADGPCQPRTLSEVL